MHTNKKDRPLNYIGMIMLTQNHKIYLASVVAAALMTGRSLGWSGCRKE